MRSAYRLGPLSAIRATSATRFAPLLRSGGCGGVALALAQQQEVGVGPLQRRGEQVALRQPGPAVAEVGALQLLLDALGDDLQVEGAAEVDQPAQDGRHGLLVVDGADEGP